MHLNESITPQGHMSLQDYYVYFGELSYEVDGEHTDRELTKNEMALVGNYLSGIQKSVHLCCGAARHVEAFSSLGICSIGIDLSPYLVAAGSKKLRQNSLDAKGRVVLGEATVAPIRSQSADCVTILGNSLTLFDKDAGNRLFWEAKRMLNSSGIVIIDIPCTKHVTDYFCGGQRNVSKRIRTRRLGEVDVAWVRHLDEKSNTVSSLETYSFVDENGFKHDKSFDFLFHLYEPEEICASAAVAHLRLSSLLRHTDTSGRYLGMLHERAILVLEVDNS